VSKLTLVRSKTDNVLVIKNKQSAARHQHHHRRRQRQSLASGSSRAGRALKRRRPKPDVDSGREEVQERGHQSPDEDMQCKIVKVILENCRTAPTTTTTTTTTVCDVVRDADSSSSQGDTAESAALNVSLPPTELSSHETPSATDTATSTSSQSSPENGREVLQSVPSAVSSTSAGTELTVVSTCCQKTQPAQLAPCFETTTSTTWSSAGVSSSPLPLLSPRSVIASAGPLRLTTALNGVVQQLPLALGQPVHTLQLLSHPVAGHGLTPVASPRWSVPLVNGAGTWLAVQPVAASTSAGSIVVPSPASFGLIPPAAQAAPPPRPVMLDHQPRVETRPVPVQAAHTSVINSPIKQFLDHTRSVPRPAAVSDDLPTDLSMKTLRRVEQDGNSRAARTSVPVLAAPEQDDVPLDLCIKRPSPAADLARVKQSSENASTTKTTPSPVVPILTVPLCFPAVPGERRTVAVAGQMTPATMTTSSCPAVTAAVKLMHQPAPTPLVKIEPAPPPPGAAVPVGGAPSAPGGGTFPVSPITILHPAFRQLSPFLCSPLLMTPLAAAAAAAATGNSVQRHPTDVSVQSSSSSST